MGEVPPSSQLLNHRKSLPNQPANCEGFVSAGLNSDAFRWGPGFAETGILGSRYSELSPAMELPSAPPSPLPPMAFPR